MKNMSLMLVLILGFYGVAQAGPLTDEMSKCLVTNTSEADKTLFIQWIYAAISSHPDVKSMSNISPEVGENINRRAAEMLLELLTVRCKAEAGQAIEFEGKSSYWTSFDLLGRASMQGLISHPQVAQYLASLNSYFDAEKLKNIFDKK